MASELEQLRKRVAALMSIQSIAQELMSELNPWRLLNKILDSAVRVLNATTGSLLILVPPNELEFVASKDPAIVGRRMSADAGLAGWVFSHEKPLIIGDASQDSRHFRDFDLENGFHTQSIITVPLMTPTEKIGVIQVINKKSGEHFDEQDQDILTALAAQAAIAYVNADLYQEVEAEKNRIIDLQDEMHKKLARDLHDGPAQQLAAMMMNVEFILKLYEREPDLVPKELRILRETAGKTLAQLRNTMFELRPVILDTQGLQAALEYYAERLRTTEGMNIHLEIRNLKERLPLKVEGLCFDIIHEAVGNVKKHARAQNTWIAVERRAKDLIVAIKDDGKGFDVSQVTKGYDRRGSLGMINMRERAQVLNARYEIKSAPGRGTLVYLIAQIDDQETTLDEDTDDAAQASNGRRKRETGPLRWPEDGPPLP
jgi:signal transduction histidine kinase